MLTDSIKKIVSVALVSVFLLMPLAGCSEETENKIPANYGSYGADFARQLATTYPYRKPFSSQETAAGEMIRLELSNLGYDVVTQPFSTDEGSSNNYIVTIEGKGFMGETEEGSGEYTDVRRSVVIGAHYDSAYGSDDIPEDYTYDGISDNASGVGCLMTIANRISEYENIGFDVTIVFFGAGNADHAGARAYYASLTQEEKESMEVMYCVESIYGGDKVYASAGFNSLELSQKYAMRRKLYQAYDVAYDSELASRNGFSLLYNECGIQTDLDEDGVDELLIGFNDGSTATKFTDVLVWHSDLGAYKLLGGGSGYYIYLCAGNVLAVDSWYGSQTERTFMTWNSKTNSFPHVDGEGKYLPMKWDLTEF